MTNLITAITLLSYLATCARLLLYRRGRANYHCRNAIKAWCLIVCTGSAALHILLHPGTTSFGHAGIAVTLFLLVFRARGNVANLTKTPPQ